MNDNAFFKVTDPKVIAIGGETLNPSWWSRPWEYHWASLFTDESFVVADMGAGWSGRPFKEFLADSCAECIAVDKDKRLVELPNDRPNLHYFIGDFEKTLDLPPLDRIFCISVLEDLANYYNALTEFYRLLKPGGKVILTCDTRYDSYKPLPRYPGVSFELLFNAVQDSGFGLPDGMDMDMENVVRHDEWNLCVWHMVLTKNENA